LVGSRGRDSFVRGTGRAGQAYSGWTNLNTIKLSEADIKLNLDTPCIEWTGSRHDDGYGTKWQDGKLKKVHRIEWENHHGPIPPGINILHGCDNPPCYNIEHLFAGTQADNVRDMARKGRHGRSTLTNEQCQQIRERRAAGEKVHPLAAEYGVAPGTISRIANGVRRAL
jgi:hypothetical protein